MRLPVLLASALLAALLAGGPAFAQREGYSYLSFVGSDVSLVSRGEDDAIARVNSPVMAGDRLATGSSSRSEAVLADGGILRVDARSTVRFDRLARTWESDDDRTLLYLERGGLALETRSTAARDVAPRIDTDDASVLVPDRSVVRVDAGRRGTEVYVLEGRVEVTARSGRAWVSAGEYAWASGEEAIEVSDGGLPRDRFTRFLEERRERPADSSGVRYVSSDYSYDYESSQLDSYGGWTWVPSFNSYCWRPVVGADWAPYTSGYWRWTPAGMTWVSYEPWGWLPYHYGSWSFEAAFGWCWMPGTYYSPAWVYWSYQPGWVGWCPMGYYGGYTPWWGSGHGGGRGGGWRYPYLTGRFEMGRIDRRGWSFVSAGTIGGRFDRGSVVRGDRLDVRSTGSVGLIATAPLRIDRGSGRSAASAVQEAVRKIPAAAGLTGDLRSGGRAEARADEGLTAILRRDASLPPSARQQLDASWTRAGRDGSYRPASAEALASGRRPDAAPGAGREVTQPSGQGVEISRSSGGVVRGTDRLSGGFGERSPAESWRDTGAHGSSALSTSGGAPRRSETSGSSGRASDGAGAGPSRGVVRGDDGWRRSTAGSLASPGSPSSPAPRSRTEPGAPAPRGSDSNRTNAPPRSAPSARPSGSDSWRSSSPAPQGGRSTSPSPSYAPPSGRSAPAPSSSAPPPSRPSSPPSSGSAPGHSGAVSRRG